MSAGNRIGPALGAMISLVNVRQRHMAVFKFAFY